MSKLLEYRKALTIREAAEQLEKLLGERVADSDILRLGLDGHLTLSVDLFNLAPGEVGNLVPKEEVVVYLYLADDFDVASCPELENAVPIDDGLRAMSLHELSPGIKKLADEGKVTIDIKATHLPEAGWVQFSREVQFLSGLWDLVMEGPVRLDIEARYRRLVGAPEVTVSALSPYVLQRQSGEFAMLLEAEKSQVPKIIGDPLIHAKGLLHAASIPRDAQLVVRPVQLENLVEKRSTGNPEAEPEAEKPLTTTERNTLLCMISALCAKVGINPSERGSASRIVRLLDKHGTPHSEETVRNHLRKIEDAVESRTK